MSIEKRINNIIRVLVIGLLVISNRFGFTQLNTTLNDNLIFLENADVKVSLSKDEPIIYEYLNKSVNSSILGNYTGSEPGVTFFQGAESVLSRLSDISYTCSQTENKIKYHVVIKYKDKPAVEFDLIYSLANYDVIIEFNNVFEHENFKLINVNLPGLISVKATTSSAMLAIPAGSGRLINVAQANIGSHEYDINWLNAILAGIAYDSKVLGVIDTKSLENHTIASISERNGIKYGSFSMRLIYRLENYALEEFGQILPVDNPDYLLKVQDSCILTISISGDYDKDGFISWVDGTKLLRDRIETKSDPYYADKSIIKWFLDWPESGRYTTFSEVLESVKSYANQTDAPNRIIYLAGWQYYGHDSGYPSVDKVNQRLGGYDGLEKLVMEAKKYNVIISFHDNYDDAYKENPGWDPDVICRDAQGNLMKGGRWDGGQSYLISSYKYAQKSGLDRVRNTLKQYPFIKETYHLDVLAGGYNNGRKYDFNPDSPAGAQKNFDGKKMIIQEFNKHGIDVTTEDFSGFFVGHVGFFLKILDQDNVYFRNEEKIPLIPFIYHSKTNYGMRMRGDRGFLQRLIYGDNMGTNDPGSYILDALPRHLMYGKAMDFYTKDGDYEKIIYEDGSYIEVNYATLKYTVSLKDRVIAKDFTSFVPRNDYTYFACCKFGGRLNYPIPGKWSARDKIKVYRMNEDGTKIETPFKLTDNNIELFTEPNVIYKVVCTK
ncbi:MAG: hypothetical protein AMS27_08830 [Bacteroides sp. SM23_62_1]|nr:MAG: hypothetical protein AMS27_08830 [Bacteroides sp. SM23_62_1]